MGYAKTSISSHPVIRNEVKNPFSLHTREGILRRKVPLNDGMRTNTRFNTLGFL